jgi:hypothetical protein
MPNKSDPGQNPTQPTNQPGDQPVAPPIASIQADLPPLPPDFQNVTPENTTTPLVQPPSEPISPPSSTSPPDLPPVVSTKPKKKFAGGRVIATILGILLLIGGVGAGIFLTQQKQLFEQKATYIFCNDSSDCAMGNSCTANGCVPTNGECVSSQDCSGGMSCNNGQCVPPASAECDNDTDCSGGERCNTTLGRCVQGSITCVGDLDCPSGEGCSGGQCTSLCSNSGDCSGGKICAAGECIPPNSDCGRDSDPGAPVCCVGSCGGQLVCEGSNRLECNTGGQHCTVDADGCTEGQPPVEPPGGTPNPPGSTPTPPPGTAQCAAVLAYRTISDTQSLTPAELSALSPGDVIHFCVGGNGSGLPFDRARFEINGTLLPETTTLKPNGSSSLGMENFCQEYTIGPTVTTVSVKASIHHTVSGWVGQVTIPTP